MFIIKKILKFFLFLVIVMSFAAALVWNKDFSNGKEPKWGVTFSKKYAQELGLDWKKTYLDILDDLSVHYVRLPVYWNEVERVRDEYDFSDIEWQLSEAQKRGVNVLLVIGRRQPRWPECHDPEWVDDLDQNEIEDEVLELLSEEVRRFSGYGNIYEWQLENEPLLSVFGRCPKTNRDFLEKEIAFVESLEDQMRVEGFGESSRTVMLTDSGELSLWMRTSQFTRLLGTTIYRKVWNKHLGYFTYFFVPPSLYHYKAELIKTLSKTNMVIISEMQMEPWVPSTTGSIVDIPLDRQKEIFDIGDFQENIDFARRTGFSQVYLWGAEWWYWLKEVHGDNQLWNEAKRVVTLANRE